MAASLAALGSLSLAAAATAAPLPRSAFVTARGASVYYFPTASNTPVNPLAFGGSRSIAITPDGAHAYVVNNLGTIAVLNTANDPPTVASTSLSIPGATNVAISPDGSTAYVGNSTTTNITKIDTATNTVSGTINNGTGTAPDGVAVTPDGSKLVIATRARDSDAKGIITVRNTSDGSVVGTPIALGIITFTQSVAITPDGTKAYVGNTGNNDVTVVNIADSTVDTTISSGGNHPWIGITPDGAKAYAVNANGSDVTVIDTATNTVDAHSPVTVGLNPNGLGITPDGNTAYVANTNTSTPGPVSVSVIHTATDVLGSPITFGAFPGDAPDSIVVTPDQGPSAAFTDTPAQAGTATSFDATASTDPDGTVASYHWSFGDSTTATTLTPTTTHMYAAGGNYTVTLRVTDNEGCSKELVFTGQTAYCNPNTAQTGSMVTIPAAPTIPPSGGAGGPAPTPAATTPAAPTAPAAPTKKCKKAKKSHQASAAKKKCKKK